MAIDPSNFHLVNVVDTCAVWNILSSRLLHSTASDAQCDFCITETVRYECIEKKRTTPTAGENELQERLRRARNRGQFKSHSVSIEDIQALEGLRGKMGRGELSSVAFARKIGHAVLTDDQKARRRAAEHGCLHVQTTPHLLSWLLFRNRLGDSDLHTIVTQHEEVGGTLSKHFRDAAGEARMCQLNAAKATGSPDAGPSNADPSQAQTSS